MYFLQISPKSILKVVQNYVTSYSAFLSNKFDQCWNAFKLSPTKKGESIDHSRKGEEKRSLSGISKTGVNPSR